MANWRLNLKKFFQALCIALIALWKKLQRSQLRSDQLAKTCEKLQKQLVNSPNREKAWKTYTEALSLAKNSDHTKLAQVILKFDPLFGEQGYSFSPVIGQALSFLLEAKPQTSQNLDAAWRIAHRLNEPSSVREIQQQICRQLGLIGDSNTLLAKLVKRRGQDTLNGEELSQILSTFLEHHSFQLVDPWRAFFGQLQIKELPRIHQVYAILDRPIEASELAESVGDYRRAISYLKPLASREIAFRILTLSNQLRDEIAIAQAHQQVAESFWQENNFIEALQHFESAGNLEQVSNCHQQLGALGQAIQCRPSISAKWIQDIRQTLETTVRGQIERQEFLASVCLLKLVEDAWREKSQAVEAERTQCLLASAVKTARSALTSELQRSEGQSSTDLFKRWSLLEESAGNYLEAGLQAEKAQDYFAASVLFEKANAFGQALVALESASPTALDPRKKAQLLEQGGNFFLAGLLYERLGELDRAIALYEQADEFLRAASLRQQQIGDEQAVFDEQFKTLLTKAGQIEQLAQLCLAQASAPLRSADEKAQLWRRIKALGEQGLVGQKWLDRVTVELPEIEALDRQKFEEQAALWLKIANREILADYSNVIGLDLGTSNSVVCLYNKRQGEAEVVESQGRRQIPSIFAIDRSGREVVGVPISELLSKSPRAIITKAKREMGTDRKFRAGGQEYRPEEISARIINYARQLAIAYLQKKIAEKVSAIASRTLGSSPPTDWVNDFLDRYPPIIPLTNAVITVPAYFNDAQKQATKTAGVLADICILRLIHEPTAACLAQRIREGKSKTILVADLGAGTFDLSMIEVGEGIFEVLEIEGDNSLGSADLDELIYTHFLEFTKAETGQAIPPNSQAATRLRQACEELKIELSSQSEWVIDLPYLIGDRHIRLTLTRSQLERLASPWLEQIKATCLKIKLKPNRVLLIGGGGLMPAVYRCIRDIFKLEPSSAYDPLTIVARGAVLQAAVFMGDLQNMLVLDVTPFSLGIKCQVASEKFEFDAIISKHTTIPTSKTRRYTTREDDQRIVKIEVFQGESSVTEENFKIGEFLLQGIPLAKAGVPQIDVEFEINLDCLLTVTARDAVTGNQQSITIADSHLLTPAQTDSLQTRFRNSQIYQASLATVEKIAAELKTASSEIEKADFAEGAQRFQQRIETYEQDRKRYLPTAIDNSMLFEIYRDRLQLEEKTRLALDLWSTLSRSVRLWLESYGALNWRSTEIATQVQQLLDEGDRLIPRVRDAHQDIIDIAANYQKWLSVLENLPTNLEGSAEELAQHFLSLQRYGEALTHFNRLSTPQSVAQLELGLEILARSRQRDAYTTLFLDYAERLNIHRPDFASLHHSVRVYADSIGV